jgi:phage-related protein
LNVAIEFLKQCEKEILDWPEEVREDFADALARLERGHTLSMPLSRPMPSVGSGVHELRLKDRSGIYRVIYFLVGMNQIWLIHAFQKKTQKTPLQDIALAKERLRRIK